MKVGVAWTEGDALFVDGDRVEHPYTRGLRGALLYTATGTDSAVLEAHMRPGDVAYRGANDPALSVSYAGPGGVVRVLPGSCWGAKGTPDEVAAALVELQAAVDEEGLKWGRTVATLAGRICREHVTKPAGLKQLRPRWRRLAHEGLHQGPMAVVRGGSPDAVALDSRAAFLRGMRTPVPVPGSWCAVYTRSWRDLSQLEGLVTATVWVDPSLWAQGIPPLPQRSGGWTSYPTGAVTGTWTIDLLRQALELGVELEAIHDAACCSVLPLHAPSADRVEAVAHPRLRKALYTRYWGRMASLGGYEGRLPTDTKEKGLRRFQGSALLWSWTGRGADSHRCPPDYRPDHAAFIAAHNHAELNREAARVRPGALIAAHVDCLWVDRDAWDWRTPDWRAKESGALRIYAIGVYQHGPKLAAMGLADRPLTPEKVATWGASTGAAQHRLRRWTGETPNLSPSATSHPPHQEPGEEPPGPPGGGVLWDGWTRGGWVYTPKESRS